MYVFWDVAELFVTGREDLSPYEAAEAGVLVIEKAYTLN